MAGKTVHVVFIKDDVTVIPIMLSAYFIHYRWQRQLFRSYLTFFYGTSCKDLLLSFVFGTLFILRCHCSSKLVFLSTSTVLRLIWHSKSYFTVLTPLCVRYIDWTPLFVVCQVAVGRREKLNIYGSDYETVDGTGTLTLVCIFYFRSIRTRKDSVIRFFVWPSLGRLRRPLCVNSQEWTFSAA